MNSLAKNPLSAAAATWDDPNENIEATNARIHDGVPIDKLEDRADSYIQTIFGLFPYIQLPQQPTCLEIGSGTGYIMEALDRELTRQRKSPLWIGGLDIAKNMLAKAKARLGKKKLFKFFLYDGMSVPLPEESVDFIYSVAALQHVPKPYVYNPFFEMLRIVKQEGFVAIHLLSFKHLAVQEQFFSWREEIKQQITGGRGHWHHFYSQEELEMVLSVGTGVPYVNIHDDGCGIWVCFHKTKPPIPADFDPERYLEINSDVVGTNAAEHWQKYGYKEGRVWI